VATWIYLTEWSQSCFQLVPVDTPAVVSVIWTKGGLPVSHIFPQGRKFMKTDCSAVVVVKHAYEWPESKWSINRAAIDLVPKIRKAEENLILLPNMKQLFVCTTNVRSYTDLLESFASAFRNLLFMTSFLGSSQKTFFALAYFWNQLNVEPLPQNQHSWES